MLSEQQAGKELMVRNWEISYFEELDWIDAALKQVGIPPGQLLQLIEATTELKDPKFRTAAFALLELKKRTGKSSKEAEAYIKQLDSQITAKEKQNSDWTGRIEKAKGELRDWEQKGNDERAKFESEQAQNKRILKEDGGKLNHELSKNNEVRENIEETIGLKAELKKTSLDLPTFVSIGRETVLKGGISPHIAKNIKEAVKAFGSLGKAIAEREREEKARKKAIVNLSREEKEKRGALSREEREKKDILRELDKSIAIMHKKITELGKHLDSRTKLLLDWDEQIEQNKWQWECFQLFISMLLASPSAPDSLAAVGLNLQKLSEKGWMPSGELTLPEQRRAVFIFLVMGTYLHSIHCSECKASFIVNKAPDEYHRHWSSYYCPVCHFSSYTKPDSTFLELMVSPELTKKLQNTRTLLDTIEKTDFKDLGTKLKLLDSIPNEVYKALSEGHGIEVKVLNGTD